MSERRFPTLEAANRMADLMSRMGVGGVSVLRQSDYWVLRVNSGPKTMIEVTEELLRQVSK